MSRTFSLGLVVFVVVLLASTVVDRMRSREAEPAIATPTAAVTVVDVARGVAPGELPNLVRLRADERVVAVDDRAVANDLAAGAAIAERTLVPGTYLDLTVAGAQGSRRVLVLMH